MGKWKWLASSYQCAFYYYSLWCWPCMVNLACEYSTWLHGQNHMVDIILSVCFVYSTPLLMGFTTQICIGKQIFHVHHEMWMSWHIQTIHRNRYCRCIKKHSKYTLGYGCHFQITFYYVLSAFGTKVWEWKGILGTICLYICTICCFCVLFSGS